MKPLTSSEQRDYATKEGLTMEAGTICRNQLEFIDYNGVRYSYDVPVRFVARRYGRYYYREVTASITPQLEEFYTYEPLPDWRLNFAERLKARVTPACDPKERGE